MSRSKANEPPIVKLGSGGYAVALPPGANRPPKTIYRTSNVRGPMPTNDWWSSLAWMPYSERQYPHPLAVMAGADGLRVYYPGPHIRANRAAIFGFLSPNDGKDLTLGHSTAGEFPDARDEFPDARVDGFSDWFVRVAFADGDRRMVVSYGHGSPFVYARYDGGSAKLTFPQAPIVWSGSEKDAVLGITLGKTHYGLFGPSGSSWAGLGSTTLTNRSGGKPYFSLALLPSGSQKALDLFKRYAYAHVIDTKVAWQFDQAAGDVSTTFTLTTKAYEGDETSTLFALYPHQWRYSPLKRFICPYDSVRGVMKLAAGTSFTTRMPFFGVLPSLPVTESMDREWLNRYIDEEPNRPESGTRDTYWEGKRLGKLATLAPLAEQAGNVKAATAFRQELKQRLEKWFTPTTQQGNLKSAGLFYYDDNWASLIGYPASYGSDVELNDHHFHYGYFIKAAAEIARRDPDWAAPERFGSMVDLLIRDIANPDPNNAQFPRLRNFDPYAGHSWASGHAKFGDGNNNESSSEAMNAWCAMILWGEATGDRAVRDLGVYLYTTEMAAINEYWFDVRDTNHPPDYPASVVTMVWGGKGANATWFSANPEAVHGINWLPIHGGSLYLGQFPDYGRMNYEALVAENGGTNWDQWADLVWMYRALHDSDDAVRQFRAGRDTLVPEAGNSKANTYHWIETLHALGHVDVSVTADYPLFAVFRRERQRTYVVYNMGRKTRTVTFSDGKKVTAGPGAFGIGTER